MLIIKAFHIVFVTSWFAGLFYLPRLFVNHAMTTDLVVQQQLLLMERRLFRFMTILAVPAIVLGLWLWLGYGFHGGWLHAKLTLVAGLLAYHWQCGRYILQFTANKQTHSHKFFRWFNEIPVLVLMAVVLLVVLKPF